MMRFVYKFKTELAMKILNNYNITHKNFIWLITSAYKYVINLI